MIIHVHLTPNASRNYYETHQDLLSQEKIYKVRLTAKPIEWEANKALIEFLSKELWVAKRKISLIKWAKSRHKTIEIDIE